MKTLNSVLYTLSRNKGISVKIGSKGGSGLWYCAKLTSHTHNDIDLENKIIRARETRQLNKLKEMMLDLDKWYEKKIAKWFENPRNRNKSEQKKQSYINSQMKLKESDRARLPKQIKHLEFNLESSFLNRPVVEIVDGISPDEPNTKIIYIKGYEKGDYWTIKEFTKAHLPKEEQDKFNVRLPKIDRKEQL